MWRDWHGKCFIVFMVPFSSPSAQAGPHSLPFMPRAGQSCGTARVALYADALVAAGVAEQVLSLCRRKGASLVVLAPAGQALATSILEALLPALERADIEWDIAPLSGEPVNAARAYLTTHAGIELIVCDGRSGLAQSVFDESDTRHMLPVTILINLIVEPGAGTPRPGSFPEIDWLRPDLNRGF